METQTGIIHVLVADNARMYTELLADALGRDRQIKVVSTASNSQDIKQAIQQRINLDVAVLGANLDEIPLRGIALLGELRGIRPELKGIILLDTSKREVILEAFRAGARGLFSRHEPLETLSKCVRQVHEGQVWANSEQLRHAVEALSSSAVARAVEADGLKVLSKRELEVVRSLAEGLTNREIAERLGLSQHTIKNYLFRIFDKLGVSSRMELLFLAFNQKAAATLFPAITGSEAPSRPAESALTSYLSEAEEGSATAQIALARMYLQGEGVAKNLAQAYFWYLVCEQTCLGLSGEIHSAKKHLEAKLQMEEVVNARKKAADRIPFTAVKSRVASPL